MYPIAIVSGGGVMWLADADADAADAAAAALTHKKGLTEIFYLPFFPLFTFTHSIKAEFEVEVAAPAAAVSLFSFSWILCQKQIESVNVHCSFKA